ncbi:MAG: LysM peptidoglycan-binding domain-containing protein, partial [Flavobacteriales bacterium]
MYATSTARTVLLRLIAFALFTAFPVFSKAAVDSLGVERKDGMLYTRHKVEQGETWYAVARRYSITFVELRMANKNASEMLKAGQVILVPPRSKPTDPRNQKNYMNEEQEPARSEQPAPSSFSSSF